MEIKPKEFLKYIITEEESAYYFVLAVDLDNKIVKVMEWKGTPYQGNILHLYCEVEKEYSVVVIPEKEIIRKQVTEPYVRRGMDCQRLVGYKYLFEDKELIVDAPRKFFNGTEFVDIPDGF